MVDTDSLFLSKLQILLESLGKNPYGYHININGAFAKTPEGSNIAVKIEKSKMIFGTIKEIESQDESKSKKMLVESEVALNRVYSQVINTMIDDVDLSEYVLPQHQAVVEFSKLFNCIIIKSAAYALCEKLINNESTQIAIRVGGEQKVIDNTTLIRLKRAFTNLTVTNFTNSWPRYHSRLTSIISKQPKNCPYVYTQVPQFRLLTFEQHMTDNTKTPQIFNPFMHIDDLAFLLKKSVLWNYMQNNKTVCAHEGDIYTCYFISSVEFCRATNLKHHIPFNYKGATEDFYNLFFGLLYPSKFYSRDSIYYRINDKDYAITKLEALKEDFGTNVKLPMIITEGELYYVPEDERQFYSRVTIFQYLAGRMRGELKIDKDPLVKVEMISNMLKPFKLLMAE